MFHVGLTGGIASGKSTISKLFSELGIDIIDTDEISHKLMEPDQAAYHQTLKHFGAKVLNKNKTINRSALRKIVFNQPVEKKWLENMIHPLIKQQAEKALLAATSDYAVLVVPLMYESGFHTMVDHVVAIDCPTTVQKKRLMERDGITEQLAEKMIHSQMRNDRRHARADSSLDNRSDRNLHGKIKQLHNKLKRMSKRFK